MDDQHLQIDALISEGTTTLNAWRRDAGAADRDRLADLLARLGAALTDHLAIEEKEVLPVVSEYLTAAEWHELGDHAIKGLPKSKLFIVFGMLAARAEPEVVKLMLSTAPLVPRLIMPLLGPRAYASHVRRVYGPPATDVGFLCASYSDAVRRLHDVGFSHSPRRPGPDRRGRPDRRRILGQACRRPGS
jgi:hypothetical protein